MPVTLDHFTLSPEQRHFKDQLNQFPSLFPFWNVQTRDYDLPALEHANATMSHGEQIMAKFFAAVWLGENKFNFDLINAAATLDKPYRKIIIDWLDSPVFP